MECFSELGITVDVEITESKIEALHSKPVNGGVRIMLCTIIYLLVLSPARLFAGRHVHRGGQTHPITSIICTLLVGERRPPAAAAT